MFPRPNIFGITDWYDLNLIFATIICALFVYYYLRYKTPYTFSLHMVLPWGFFMTFVGLVGARLLNVIELYTLNKPTELSYGFSDYLLYYGGYAFYGGMILNVLVLLLLNQFIRSPKFPVILDVLAMACCLAYALGRIGCQLSGDGCFGVATNLPWGMYYPYGPVPTLLPVHPTPIYELLANLVLFGLLLKINQNKKFVGQTLYTYLMGAAVLRFLIEFIRRNPEVYLGLTMSQLIAIILFCIGGIAYWLKHSQAVRPKVALQT